MSTFRLPAPDASDEEKQAALVEFVRSLKARMAHTSRAEKQRITQELGNIEREIQTYNQTGQNPSMNTHLEACVRKQQELRGELAFQENTDWDRVVDEWVQSLLQS